MNPAILHNIKKGAMPSNAIIYGDHEVDPTTSIDDRVACIFNLFEKHGEMNYIGEDVSQLQHAQQAAQQARKAGHAIHVIIGAFLHDIGHLVGIERHMERMTTHGLSGHKDGTTLGTRTHEKVGEKFLKNLGFPENVTSFVRGHVDAKRYLVYRDPNYHGTLSRASQMTLIAQGGPMKRQEAEEFEKQEDFEALLEMRRWDEQAKYRNIPLEDNKYYIDACKSILKCTLET